MFKTESKKRKWAISIFVGLVSIYFVIAGGLLILSKMAVLEGVDMSSSRGEFKSPHTFKILDRGLDSFNARIELIRRAKITIEMEFFIFDLDQASRVLMNELIKKGKEGVKVRILVDFSKPIFRLGPAYAKYLSEFGIEVRYYNTAPLYQLVSIQHRTHRKLLVIDDSEAIVGGRNIADEYFDMDPKYNFLDSDVEVSGEVVPFIRKGFDTYFGSKITNIPDVKDVSEESMSETRAFFEDHEAIKKTVELAQTGARDTLTEYPCNHVIFVTDPPSIAEEHHKIYRELIEISKTVEKEIMIESPYFILGVDGLKSLEQVAQRNINMRVLTNSLHSSDATYVISAMASHFSFIKDVGLDLHLMNGVDSSIQGELSPKARWGLHAKRAVFDRKHTLVGTYNIDPRSANLNAELVIICKDSPELAEATLKSMDERLKVSALAIGGGEVKSMDALYSQASFKMKVAMILLMPFSNLFQFLL